MYAVFRSLYFPTTGNNLEARVTEIVDAALIFDDSIQTIFYIQICNGNRHFPLIYFLVIYYTKYSFN